jgi:serine/threonine protein kinase
MNIRSGKSLILAGQRVRSHLPAIRDGRRLYLQNPGGEPLDRFLGRPLELSEALRLAIGVAAALGKLHERGLIHKDLKPANILVEPASAKAWLMGFGIASRLPREHKSADSSEVIADTLPYMAPNRPAA